VNAKAARAARAWVAAMGGSPGAQRAAYDHAKRSYAQLSHRERGTLRRDWSEAEAVRHLRGEHKQRANAALVRSKDLKL